MWTTARSPRPICDWSAATTARSASPWRSCPETAIRSGLAVAAHAADAGGGLAGEWLTAYTDYLKRAADQTSSTIELYQQVTDRIVSGELAPTATQDLLGSFVQSRGTAYSDQLAQLNM